MISRVLTVLRLWGSRIRSPVLISRFHAACSYSLIKPAKHRSTLDPFIAEVRHGMGRSWRAKFAGAVRPLTVVVPNVVREHQTQVPLIEDQYAVGGFGSDRA